MNLTQAGISTAAPKPAGTGVPTAGTATTPPPSVNLKTPDVKSTQSQKVLNIPAFLQKD